MERDPAAVSDTTGSTPPAPMFWDEIFDQGLAGGNSSLPFLGIAQALASRAELVADVGCGRGWYTASGTYRPFLDLRGPARRVVGIDIDPVGEQNRTIDEFRPIDAAGRWPLADGEVDLAVSDYTLEHVADPGAFLGELARVLRPGGAFIARTVSRFSPLALAARAVPNEKHSRVLAKLQPGRAAADVFPTEYRMNSDRDLRALFARDFELSVAHRAGFDRYFGPWPRLARTVSVVEPHLPKPMQMSLVVYARRR